MKYAAIRNPGGRRSGPDHPASFAAIFTKEQMDKLSGHMHKKKVTKGNCFYWDGDPEDHLYYLQNGLVRIAKSTECGRTFTVSLMREDDFFGLSDPFNESIHQFSAQALEDCEAGAIPRARLAELLQKDGELAVRFIRWMSLTQKIAESKMRDLIMYGKYGALCSLLIRLANTCGEAEASAVRIGVKLSHSELANMVGTTRETINRMLSELKRDGAVSVRNGYILIHDMEHLRSTCNCDNCPVEICRM